MSKLGLSKKRLLNILLLISIFSLILNIPHGSSSLNSPPTISIEFSSLLGGSQEDDSYNIIFDDENNIIVAGATRSSDFPIIGGFNSNYTSNGKRTGIVAKFSHDGKLIFSTFLGGNGHDTIRGLSMDSENHIIVVGDTTSTDFPITSDALYSTYGGGSEGYLGLDFCCGDGFLSILSSDLSTLIYSTYIAGSGIEGNLMLKVDNDDRIIISGFTTSIDYPNTPNSFQNKNEGLKDLFITILTPNGSKILYSSYIGGEGDEFVAVGNYLALDDNNNIYITGGTSSSNFPTTGANFNSTFGGEWDVFIAKLSKDNFNIEYSSYIGGNKRDFGFAIDVDNESNIYITGTSNSENYPVSKDAFQPKMNEGQCLLPSLPICGDGFITKLSNDGKIVHSSYFGGSDFDNPQSIIIDDQKNVFITGFTFSRNFPTIKSYQESYGGGTSDYFVTIISGTSFTPLISTYIGEKEFEMSNRIGLNNLNELFLTGWTASRNFLTTDNSSFKGVRDVVIMKLDINLIESNNSSDSIDSKNSVPSLTFISFSLGIIIFYVRIKTNNDRKNKSNKIKNL